MSMPPASLPGDVAVLDDIHRRRLQTLLAVDEMVEAVVGKLEEIGVINETFIWFLSDNGYHIGKSKLVCFGCSYWTEVFSIFSVFLGLENIRRLYRSLRIADVYKFSKSLGDGFHISNFPTSRFSIIISFFELPI